MERVRYLRAGDPAKAAQGHQEQALVLGGEQVRKRGAAARRHRLAGTSKHASSVPARRVRLPDAEPPYGCGAVYAPAHVDELLVKPGTVYLLSS